MTEITFTELKEGEGINSSLQNKCLICGWVGTAHYAHNDYQLTNLLEERREHKCNDK